MATASAPSEGLESASQPYPLGVLFVHGIGEQPRGDTLRRFADPVVFSIDLWINSVARKRSRQMGQVKAKEWAQRMPTDLHDVERSMAVRFQAWQLAGPDDDAPLTEADRAGLAKSSLWSGAAVLRDGHLPPPGMSAEFPPHAVLDMHLMGEHYDTEQREVLMAESWWSQSFVQPAASALLAWVWKIWPLALGMQLADPVRRLGERAFAANTALWRRLLAGAAAVLALLLMIILVPLSLVVPVALIATLFIGLLPVPMIRNAMQALQRLLTGTVGDSFLMAASAVSRATMVGQFKRDLAWLSARCQRVIVVAHSQGCAVSFLGLCEVTPAKLHSVTWLGSGMRKLEILRSAERRGSLIVSGWCVAACPMVFIALQLWRPSTWSLDNALGRGIAAFFLVASFVVGVISVISRTQASEAMQWVDYLRRRGVAFFDIFSTHDPVPNGALFDSDLAVSLGVETTEVRNRDSILSDHTNYLTNIEEVALPLGLRIAALAGLPLDALFGHDDAWLQEGKRRRAHRVSMLAGLRMVFFAFTAAIVVAAPQAWWDFARATYALARGAVTNTSATANELASLSALGPVVACVGIAFVVLMWVWRGWDLHEQRQFLAREQPGTWTLTGLTLVAGQLLAVPLCFALWEWTGVAPLHLWLISILGSLFLANFYVFSLKSCQWVKLPNAAQ